MLNEQPPPIRTWLGPTIRIVDPPPPPAPDRNEIRKRVAARNRKRAEHVEESDNGASDRS